MTKKKAKKVPMKLVRIDRKTLIEVTADTNDEVARQRYIERLDHSHQSVSLKNQRRKKPEK